MQIKRFCSGMRIINETHLGAFSKNRAFSSLEKYGLKELLNSLATIHSDSINAAKAVLTN